MLTGQPHSLPVTAAPMMDTLPPITASIAVCSTVAAGDDDRLVQSLTGPVLRDEKSFDRSKSEPSDTDGSVKSKPMPQGMVLWYGEKNYM